MKNMNKQSGQTLVEFALLFPLLIFLVLALFDLGRAILYYSTLNTAVREGTRLAIVQPDCDYRSSCTGGYLETYPLLCDDAVSPANISICNAVVDHFYNLPELTDGLIKIEHIADVDDPRDQRIRISIDYLFEPITPGITLLGDIQLNVSSEMLMAPIAQP